MSFTIKRGSRSKQLLFFAADATDGQGGKTGLSPAAKGAVAAYVREGDAKATAIPLVVGERGAHVPGGLVEVDAALAPGVYELGLPDEVFAEGADAAIVLVRFPGAIIEPIAIALVAYDAQDSVRLGMSALGPEGRVAALRGAFPRLTAQERTLAEALVDK
jgi:hypothetical protein